MAETRSFSFAGFNAGAYAGLQTVYWTVSWNLGSTEFTVTGHDSGSPADLSVGKWQVYIFWDNFNTAVTSGRQGRDYDYYEFGPGEGQTSYGHMFYLSRVPTDTTTIGVRIYPTASYIATGYTHTQDGTALVSESTLCGSWNPAFTVTVYDAKKVQTNLFRDETGAIQTNSWSQHVVEMHTSWRSDQLRYPSQYPHNGYTYDSSTGYTSVSNITKNTILYNIYFPNTYTATYVANSDVDTVYNIPSSGTVEYESIIPPDDDDVKPTKVYVVTLDPKGGYVTDTFLRSEVPFNYWQATINGVITQVQGGSSYVWTQNVTFTAQWGSVPAVNLPVPKRAGYKFAGWGWEDGLSPDTSYKYPAGDLVPQGNITLFALWEESGIVHIYSDGQFKTYAVWIYLGDGGGPNQDGWHHATPMIYCTVNGTTGFHMCG